MKARRSYTGTVHDRGGSRSIEFARLEAPGPGMSPIVHTRFCCKCVDDRPAKGGRFKGPLFICALHVKPTRSMR